MNYFILGKLANRPDLEAVKWSPDAFESVNAHGLICGGSGAGKTTLIKEIVTFLNALRKHIFVFDLKGDMIFTDAAGNSIGNYIDITAWDTKHGISLFEFDTGVNMDFLKEIIADPSLMTNEVSFKLKNSGPRVQVNRLIEILVKDFFPNLGVKQKDYLKHLFMDTYILKGFRYNKIETWTNELPTLSDTLELIKMIKKYNGNLSAINDDLSAAFIDEVKPEILNIKILTTRIKENDYGEDQTVETLQKFIKAKQGKIQSLFDGFIEEAKEVYKAEDIDKITPSKWFKERHVDVGKYESKDAVRKIEELESYLISLQESGIFDGAKLPIRNGLNVINISGLDVPFQRVFVDITLGKVFKACKIRGEYSKLPLGERSRGEKCDTYFIIDETKLVSGSAKEKNDPYSYLNRIATESRGNGLALLVASQSAEHYPPEFLKNFHLQIILNTSIADSEIVRKMFDVDKETLRFTQNGWGNALVKTGKVFQKIKLESHAS